MDQRTFDALISAAVASKPTTQGRAFEILQAKVRALQISNSVTPGDYKYMLFEVGKKIPLER